MAKQNATLAYLKYVTEAMDCDLYYSDDAIDQDPRAQLDHLEREEAKLRQSNSPMATLRGDAAMLQQSCDTLATLHAKAVAAETQQREAEDALIALNQVGALLW
jgi:hypothetical protein